MAKQNPNERIAEIKAKPYTVSLVREDDGTWYARVEEFSGCMTVGRTKVEALEMLDDAMTGWLSVMLEDGDPIPEPRADMRYSGKTQVRLGPSLHRLAARAAEQEGVSLNHFIVTQVAKAIGAS